jgi:type III secretion protein J
MRLRLLVPLLLALLLTGCKTALYSRMSELDANDALYTLLQAGIDAEKRPDPEAGAGHFALWVAKDDQARAIGLLKANAQPEFKHPTLGDLFARNQLISTPGEERIRFVFGTEQAIAQTLSKIDGVLVARVHIVLPLNDPLATDVKPSSASVFIKHRNGQDLSANVPAIKDLVVRSIEGLALERVAVTLFPTGGPKAATSGGDLQAGASASFMGLNVPASSVNGLWLRLLLALAIGAAIAGALLRTRKPAAPARRATSAIAGTSSVNRS